MVLFLILKIERSNKKGKNQLFVLSAAVMACNAMVQKNPFAFLEQQHEIKRLNLRENKRIGEERTLERTTCYLHIVKRSKIR